MSKKKPRPGDGFDARLEKMLEALSYAKPAREAVEKAYQKAKALHAATRRASGEAYISHPLAVAELLARFRFDSDVLQAALLHDTVEDEHYTLEEVEREFGPNVRGLVDAVTKADAAGPGAKSEDEAERAERKRQRGEDTFRKLMEIAQEHPEAVYIKFADRLHNLRTIDVKPSESQEQKREDTLPYIEIARKIGARYFKRELENECLRIHAASRYQEVQAQYESILRKNGCAERFLASLLTKLQGASEFQYSMGGLKKCGVRFVHYRKFLPLELIGQQKSQPDYLEHMPLLKRQISLYRVHIIYDDAALEEPWDKFVQFFWRLLRPQGMHLDVVEIGGERALVFCLSDSLGNRMLVDFMSPKEILNHELGSPNRESFPLSVSVLENLGTRTITVLTNKGEKVEISEGATVLDFAFKLHTTVGLCTKQAFVNNRKVPLYTVLEDENEVDIRSTSGQGEEEPEYQAKLQWFNIVRTANARKKLILYFQEKLNALEGKN